MELENKLNKSGPDGKELENHLIKLDLGFRKFSIVGLPPVDQRQVKILQMSEKRKKAWKSTVAAFKIGRGGKDLKTMFVYEFLKNSVQSDGNREFVLANQHTKTCQARRRKQPLLYALLQFP